MLKLGVGALQRVRSWASQGSQENIVLCLRRKKKPLYPTKMG